MMHGVYSGQAVKRAAWQFLTGKAASALLTFVILLWLVRLLPVAEYGAYVVFIAGTELGFALAMLGLPWLAARYLPDYRLHAPGPMLARFCLQLAIWQGLALTALTGLGALLLDVYLTWVGLGNYRGAAWGALALLVFEGQGRFLREGLMAPLMLQSQTRFSLVFQLLVFIVALGGLVVMNRTDLPWVLGAQAGASALGWLVAAISLARHLRSLQGQAGAPGWQAPHIAEQWGMALRMYGAHLVSLAYGPQVLLNLIQRTLGAEAAALFGFLRTLQEQAARYLPATLLFSVLRPRLMASHLQGGLKQMAREVNLAGKLSLFALLPLIVLVALAGDPLVALLSGGKFAAGGAYLLGLLLALLPFSQRQLIETVAVASGRAGLCTLGAGLGLLALPLLYLLLHLGLGLWAPILAIVFGQVLFNVTVLSGLARQGYRADWSGAVKLAASALLAWLVASSLTLLAPQWPGILAACGLAGVLFLVLAWQLQAFTPEERQRLTGLLIKRPSLS
jgi:O-antigen/teichoic acid export membrane protein